MLARVESCARCGAAISVMQAACPYCGTPMSRAEELGDGDRLRLGVLARAANDQLFRADDRAWYVCFAIDVPVCFILAHIIYTAAVAATGAWEPSLLLLLPVAVIYVYYTDVNFQWRRLKMRNALYDHRVRPMIERTLMKFGYYRLEFDRHAARLCKERPDNTDFSWIASHIFLDEKSQIHLGDGQDIAKSLFEALRDRTDALRFEGVLSAQVVSALTLLSMPLGVALMLRQRWLGAAIPALLAIAFVLAFNEDGDGPRILRPLAVKKRARHIADILRPLRPLPLQIVESLTKLASKEGTTNFGRACLAALGRD